LERFLNALKGQAVALDRSVAQPRFATVTSVDPTRPAVRVLLQPENVLTGWLPVLSPWIGNGWGICCPPSPGDQVFIVAQEGNSEHGVVVGRAWSDSAQTPHAPSGEIWLVHKTGASIKLIANGTVQIQGDLYLAGNLFVTGDVNSKQHVADSTGTLDRLRQHYDGHTHIDSHGGVTSTTSQTD